jgi:regulation of enolase protein 1 (concanavalin A-like superfamily)
LKPALAILATLTLEKLAASEQVTLIHQHRQAYPVFFQIFESQVIQAYYANSVVLTSLGVNAPSPYPGGYDVEETDWSLLDPVRGREPFYRILEPGE